MAIVMMGAPQVCAVFAKVTINGDPTKKADFTVRLSHYFNAKTYFASGSA